MSTDTISPDPCGRRLHVTVEPGPGVTVVPSDDPAVAIVMVPVVRVPVDQISDKPAQRTEAAAPAIPAAAPSPLASTTINTEALPDDPVVLKQMIAELIRALRHERRGREDIQQRLDALLKRLYGPRPERSNPDQGSLFGEADASLPLPLPPPPASAPEEEEKPSRRGQGKRHGRRHPPQHLRTEPRRYELTSAERLCPDCGQERQEIGVETSPQLEYKPAEVFVISHQRVKYACKCCEGKVVIAPKPAQPIDKGFPGPGLLAQIIMDKYQDHLPLHRTEQRFARSGVELRRSTMGDWMAACAKLLTDLHEKLKEHVLKSKVLHTDDTTVPVRDESLTKHRYGRMWNYIGDADHPGIVFDYTKTHARDGPATFLKGFRGYLQADAYGAYDGIYIGSNGGIIEIGCWAHARMYFDDAQATNPEHALAAKAWIRKLYDVEDKAKDFSSAERLRLRQEEAVPLLTTFKQWLLGQKILVLPKSPIATAINYTLNQWDALYRYTTDGDLHIDNNVSERTLKLIGMGRDNWLFLGSDEGGKTAAILFSFTATCKLLKIDTFAYLRDVLERLPSLPADRLDELLPHRWQATRAAASVPTPASVP